MAENDPKHTSNKAKDFLTGNHVNWWRTAMESPDSNTIENLWNELKEYSRCVIKLRIEGIKKFWEIVTVAKCAKYINHLKKVLRIVVELNGAATAY